VGTRTAGEAQRQHYRSAQLSSLSPRRGGPFLDEITQRVGNYSIAGSGTPHFHVALAANGLGLKVWRDGSKEALGESWMVRETRIRLLVGSVRLREHGS